MSIISTEQQLPWFVNLPELSAAPVLLIKGKISEGLCQYAKQLAASYLQLPAGQKIESCPDYFGYLLPEHPDKRAILIEVVRDLSEFLAYRPSHAHHKVAVIGPIDKMHMAASSALLKPLEDSIGNKIVIMFCEHVRQVPDTIISRSRLHLLPALDPQQVEQWLDSKQVAEPSKLSAYYDHQPLLALAQQDNYQLIDTIAKQLLLGAQAKLVRSMLAPMADYEFYNLMQKWSLQLLACRWGAPARYFPDHAQALLDLTSNFDYHKLLAVFEFHQLCGEIKLDLAGSVNPDLLFGHCLDEYRKIFRI